MKSTAIPPDAPAVLHGTGLFETMLAVRGRIPFAEAHFARLWATAARLHFPAPERAGFARALAQLDLAAGVREAAVRVQWLAVGDDLDAKSSWRLFATSAPVPESTLSRRRHGRAITLAREYSRSLPFAKTTSWLVSRLGLRHALASDADEGFFVDARGRILEGTSTNVFAIAGDRLLTAPDHAVLPGIIRGWVIGSAPSVGWRVVYRSPSPEQLLDGGFMTSSLTKIAAVRRLDGEPCRRIADPRFEALKKLLARELYAS